MSTDRRELTNLCARMNSEHGVDCMLIEDRDGHIETVQIAGKNFGPIGAAEYMREKLSAWQALPRGKARVSWRNNPRKHKVMAKVRTRRKAKHVLTLLTKRTARGRAYPALTRRALKAVEMRVAVARKNPDDENPITASRSDLLMAAHASAVRGAIREAKTLLTKAAKIRTLTMAEIAKVWKHCLPDHLKRNPWTPSKRALASLGRLVRRVKGRVTRRNVSGSASGQRLKVVKCNPRRRSTKKRK